MSVTQQEAYAEACQALGETIVMQRLLLREVEALRAQAATVESSTDADTEVSP